MKLEQNHITLQKNIVINYYTMGNRNIGSLCNDFENLHTLVFLHGLTNEALTWEPLMPYLNQDNLFCIFVDLPGHGKSTIGKYAYDVDFYSDIVHQFLEALHLSKVTLIGHSLGGQTAIYLTLNYSNLIDKIILIAPAGFETFSFMESMMMQRAVSFPATLSRYLTLLRPKFRQNNYVPIDEILESQELMDVVAKSIKGMLRFPIFSELSEIKQPVLVFFGEKDMAIPNAFLHPNQSTTEIAQHGARQLSNSQLEIIEDAGHFVHIKYPALVTQKIVDFLEKVTVE